MFSSSAFIRLNKDVFEGQMCQTNNFVKPNFSSLLSPFRKRGPSQLIKHIRNTKVSCITSFNKPCSSMLHPLNFIIVVFLVWVPDSGAILHKRVNQRKVITGLPFRLRHKNESLEIALFVMVAICFDYSK